MITGAARAFESPSMAALLPNLVARNQLQHASAWSTSANQTAQILGPAMGGLLYGLGASTVYGAVTAAFVVAACAVSAIRIDDAVRMRAPLSFAALFSGVSFIRSKPVILGALSLDLFAVLLGGATALLPVFARDILHTGPWDWACCERRRRRARWPDRSGSRIFRCDGARARRCSAA
jgi:MFS family permease